MDFELFSTASSDSEIGVHLISDDEVLSTNSFFLTSSQLTELGPLGASWSVVFSLFVVQTSLLGQSSCV